MNCSIIISLCNFFLEFYCTCGQGEYGTMIACDGPNCQIVWFHIDCVGIAEEDVPEGEWFCDICKGLCCLYTCISTEKVHNLCHSLFNPSGSAHYSVFPTLQYHFMITFLFYRLTSYIKKDLDFGCCVYISVNTNMNARETSFERLERIVLAKRKH